MICRVFGAAIFVIAALYTRAAFGYEVGFGDPLGPKVFPLMLAIPTMLIGLSLVIWPGVQFSWASPERLLVQLATVVVLFGFVFGLERLGFVPMTAAMIVALALLMQARPLQAVLTGTIAAPALWALFDLVLDLPLPFLGTWIT